MVSVTNPLGDTTGYTYDDLGNLTSIRDANSHVTAFDYDALNRRIRRTWPDGTFDSFVYDALGNLLSHRLPDGATNTFAYDAMGRLTQGNYFDGQALSFAYTATSQRASVADARGTTSYTYDDLDRLTGVTVPLGATVSYQYDDAGNRRSMITPIGVATYAYDGANRLSALTDPFGNTYRYSYDLEGRRTRLDLPNGVAVEYSYDTLDRLTGITQRTSSSLLASYNYTLDPSGNRLGVTEADGSSIAWTYDDAYRLIGETRLDPSGSPTTATTFTYDPVGNRLTMSVDGVPTNYTFNNLDQLLSAGGTSFTYDARGNVTQASSGVDVTAYSGDALDRLNDVNLPDGTALAYTYDADGRRVRQVVGGAETNYLWDENSLYGDVALETDAGGAPLASYVLGGPELLSQTRSGSTSYYLADAQGSTRALANSSGAITDTYDFTAFGELLASTGTTANSYLYNGQQFDARTALYSLRARYYDPGLGRFLSRDPIGVQTFAPLELNRYVYAANNPVTLLDPRGLASDVESGLLTLVAFLAARPLVAAGLAVLAAYYVPLMVFGLQQIAGAPPREFPRFPTLPRMDTEALLRQAERALALAGTIVGCAYLRSISIGMAEGYEGQGLVALEITMPSPHPCHIPVLLYPAHYTPVTAAHIWFAQNSATPRQPMLLTYLGPGSELRDINRSLACSDEVKDALKPLTCDEYPFASTLEGGATASTWGVPWKETGRQGNMLNAFYTVRLLRIPGAQFAVVVVP